MQAAMSWLHTFSPVCKAAKTQQHLTSDVSLKAFLNLSPTSESNASRSCYILYPAPLPETPAHGPTTSTEDRGCPPQHRRLLCARRGMRHALFPGVSEELLPAARPPTLALGVLVGLGMVPPPIRALLPSPHPGTHWRTSSCLVLITPLCPFYYKEGENQTD